MYALSTEILMVIKLRNSSIMADDSCSAFAAGTVDSVKEYYKKLLHGTDDLKTNACMMSCGSGVPTTIKEAISECHPEVVTKCVDVVVIGLCFLQLVFVRVHES